LSVRSAKRGTRRSASTFVFLLAGTPPHLTSVVSPQ
jgi:hypothetical protein